MRWMTASVALSLALLSVAGHVSADSTDDYDNSPPAAADASGGTISGYAAVAALNGDGGSGGGESNCGPWAPASIADLTNQGYPPDSEVTRISETGVTLTLYYRICGGERRFLWVAPISPQDVAAFARDQVTRQLPVPSPMFAPPPEAMLVNLETWFGVEPIGPITASASVPGLSVSVTATATGLTLSTGSQVRGDDDTINCRPWGSIDFPADGCVWTPAYPSVEEVTGTDDYRYHANVAVTWSVTWRSSTGASGDLGELTTSTDALIAVREIQTVGAPNPSGG
jgi:hypothetical protein